MSVDAGRRSGYEDSGWDLPPLLTGDFEGDPLLHAAAVGSLAVLSLSYLSVLYYVTDVVGGVALFVPLVLLAGGAGAVVGRTISHRTAVGIAVAVLGVGLVTYLLTVPPAFFEYLSAERILADQVAFLTGYSVLRMTNAGVWALAVAPAPTFLTWYFGARGEYVRAATVGSGTLLWFVLTGDSGSLGTMIGVLGAAGAIGFDSLATREGHREQAETVVIAVAAMVLGATLLSVTPTVGGSPVVPAGGLGGGGGGSDTLEASLLESSDRNRIQGSIRLSPEVRFTVEADQGDYWRVNAFDRFTGEGWVRTGGTEPVDGTLPSPPGPRESLEQTYTAKTELGVLPAAAEPVEIEGTDATVTPLGTVGVAGSVAEDESYSVTSQVSDASPEQLREAGTDYPAEIEESYLQLPESTPERVGNLTSKVTEDADSPYEKAKAIESYLEENKGYSLNVTRPQGNIASAFLFDMEAGYCVYFATTMVTMLRSEGIPARYVVGYTSGQRVAEDEWVVRGLNAHAWVEVYFPDYGWVRFDPTPSDPRQEVRSNAVETAREQGVEGVDAEGSQDGPYTTTTEETEGNEGDVNATGTEGIPDIVERERMLAETQNGSNASNVTGTTPPQAGAVNGTVTTTGAAAEEGDGDGFTLPALPVLAVWSLLALGAVAAVRRSGVAARAYRAAWLRVPPRGDPDEVVEGAFQRAMFVLERRERPREDTETVREYLDAVGADRRTRRLAELRETARYRGGADAEDAAEARHLVSELVGRGRGGDNV